MSENISKPSRPLVATPNIGPPSGVSMDSALLGVLGSKIRLQLTTATSHNVDGTVFAVSSQHSMIALVTSTSSTSPTTAYSLIPISAVQSFNVLAPSNTSISPTSLAPLDLPALQSRMKNAVNQLRAEEARKGKGVTREAQSIFDAFARTLPTKWDGENITVSESVTICPPYRPEDCRSAPGVPSQSLIRIKKVLEVERRKLMEKLQDTEAAGGLRKGG